MLRVGSSAHTLGSGRFVTWRAHTPAEARLDVSLAIVEEVRLHVLPARRQMTREDFSQRIRAGDGGGIPIRSPPQSVLRRRRRVAAGIWLRDVPFTLRDPKCDGPAGRPRWQRASNAGSHNVAGGGGGPVGGGALPRGAVRGVNTSFITDLKFGLLRFTANAQQKFRSHTREKCSTSYCLPPSWPRALRERP